MDGPTRRDPRQQHRENAVDVAARGQRVARIDKQDVGGGEVAKHPLRDLLDRAPDPFDGKPVETRPRLGIDGYQLSPAPAVGDGARHDPRRMPGPYLDDPAGRARAHPRIRPARLAT